jgi:hypothetical protein
MYRVSVPSDLILRLPNRPEIQVPVKYVSITTSYGVVTDVDLLPLDNSIPFREAVAELDRLMKRLKITPDQQMKDQMGTWPEDSPGFDPVKRPGFYPHTYEAGTWLTEDFGVGVRLKAADEGGWFFALTFAAQAPNREAVRRRLDTQPSTLPATLPRTGN